MEKIAGYSTLLDKVKVEDLDKVLFVLNGTLIALYDALKNIPEPTKNEKELFEKMIDQAKHKLIECKHRQPDLTEDDRDNIDLFDEEILTCFQRMQQRTTT
jgi:hypothetical protein